MSYVPPNQYQGETRKSLGDIQDKIINLQESLKSKSKYVCCPYCNKQGMTNIEQDCSVTAGILCCLGGFILPMLVQCCRGKDMNCSNTEHYCVGCSNKLASYKVC